MVSNNRLAEWISMILYLLNLICHEFDTMNVEACRLRTQGVLLETVIVNETGSTLAS
jgi:hypothetical protein